jgi:hypothetical protein
MTPDRKDLKERLADLEDQVHEEDVQVLWDAIGTDELVDRTGEPAEFDPNAETVVIHRSLVMPREQAEEEGRKILGPAEDTPPESDAVKVAWGKR